jgi:hypothetical protein
MRPFWSLTTLYLREMLLGRLMCSTQIALALTTETPLEDPGFVRAIFQTKRGEHF